MKLILFLFCLTAEEPKLTSKAEVKRSVERVKAEAKEVKKRVRKFLEDAW